MAAKIIHFGPDDCHRAMVLRSAGYSVDDCTSLVQLRACLAAGAMADALLLTDAQDLQPQEAIAMARSESSLPVVLFRSTNQSYEETGADLIVHCLTPPEVWLNEVEGVIERSRAIRARSQSLTRQSEQLRRESEVIVRNVRAERERSRTECARPPAAGFTPVSESPKGGKQIPPRFGSK